MRYASFLPCPKCGAHIAVVADSEDGDTVMQCTVCGQTLHIAVDADAGKILADGDENDAFPVPTMWRADFVCSSCGGRRSVYVTPPNPNMDGLPKKLTGTCPDCGYHYEYAIGYERGEPPRLFVDVNGKQRIYPMYS